MKIKRKTSTKKTTKVKQYTNGGRIPKYIGGGGEGEEINLNPTSNTGMWNVSEPNYTQPNTGYVSLQVDPNQTQDLSQNNKWSNQVDVDNSKKNYGSKIASIGAGLAGALSTLNTENMTPANRVTSTMNTIGDTAVSNIPGFGQFYGAARGISSGIQGAIPGKSITDPKTGITYEKKDSKTGQVFNTILEPAHTQASKTWGKAAAATNSNDKAKYAFEGIGDMFGLTTIPKIIANALGKDEDTKMYNKLKLFEKKRSLTPDTSTFKNGGGYSEISEDSFLQKFNEPSHNLQSNNNVNAHLNGNPIQLEKKETIHKGYVFSDNPKLPNPNTGNTFAKDSIKTESKYKKEYFDPIAISTKDKELEELSMNNDIARQMKETQEFAKKFKFGGSIPKARYGIRGYGKNDTGMLIDKPNLDIKMQNTGFPGYRDSNILNSGYPTQNISQWRNEILSKDNSLPITPESNVFKVEENNPKNKKNVNFDMTGDQLQLAGILPATAYNMGMSMLPADKEKALYNPYQEKVRDIMSNRMYNPQAVINENQLDFNSGKQYINDNATSDSVRRANIIAMTTNTQAKNTLANLEGQKMNNSLRAEEASVLDNLGQQRVIEDRRVSQTNAENKARKQLFGATAATQIGQGLTEAGKAKNQNVSNEIQLKVLNNIFANFGTKYKNVEDLYRNASSDEIIEFKKFMEEKTKTKK